MNASCYKSQATKRKCATSNERSTISFRMVVFHRGEALVFSFLFSFFLNRMTGHDQLRTRPE